MQLAERIQNTETHQFRMVFQNALNDNGNLFGGFAMKWMDEVAYITAIRFTRMKVVTFSVDNLKFKKAIKPGEMVEIIGRVLKAGRVKIEIQVEIFVENSESDSREKAIDATFTFAAVNKENKPVVIDWGKLKNRVQNNNNVLSSKFEQSLVY
ncbi:MAG: acyl-CoA thioesterase [Bacteroidales bacterium]|nr:acyl-CoA thioesterase [Bacteroidales bacterium]